MEDESLCREPPNPETVKATWQDQGKPFENFAAMTRACCRLPSSAEWQTVKNTLQKTLEFSIALTGAEDGNLVLLDSSGVVTDSIQRAGNPSHDQGDGWFNQRAGGGLAGWVSEHRRVGLISDTRDDQRWVPPPHQFQTARSMLAVPVVKCDELLGILTLMHSNPNHFSTESVEKMQATSDQIALTLENVRLYGRLDESFKSLEASKQAIENFSKALDEELDKGRRIQRDFLPGKIPKLPNWEIETYFLPAKQISGDFYDVFALPGNNLGIVIADVADKGVGSALFMALIRSLIRVFSGHISLHGFANFSIHNGVTTSVSKPCATTEQVNALNAVKLTNDYIAHEHAKEGMFATLFFGVIDPFTGIMAYINAGHEPVVVTDSRGIRQSLEPTGPAVGIMVDMEFKTRQVQIEPDDILIGYTDGVIEALAPDGEFFTRKRLLSIVEQTAASASELVARIRTEVSDHVHDAPPSDDITILAVHRLAQK